MCSKCGCGEGPNGCSDCGICQKCAGVSVAAPRLDTTEAMESRDGVQEENQEVSREGTSTGEALADT